MISHLGTWNAPFPLLNHSPALAYLYFLAFQVFVCTIFQEKFQWNKVRHIEHQSTQNDHTMKEGGEAGSEFWEL